MSIKLHPLYSASGKPSLIQLLKKLVANENKECSNSTFRLTGCSILLAYIAVTGVILLLESYVFSTLVQAISLLVLTSGYAIPILFRISQVNFEAGFKPLIFKSANMQADADTSGDLSLPDNDLVSDRSPDRGKIEGDFFKEYYGEPRKQTVKTRKRALGGLILPYIGLLLVVASYFLILSNPIRVIVHKYSR